MYVRRAAIIALWAVCLSSLGIGNATAHPLGNFTINHLAQVRASATQLHLHYVLDIAEIPTFQIMHSSTSWNGAAMRDWANAEGTLVAGNLSLQSNGVALPLHLQRVSARTRNGAGGLPILYWTGDYVASLPPKASIALNDNVYADRRIGWKDVVLPGGTDPTDGLRSYPSALVGSPRHNDSATFDVAAGRVINVRVFADDSADATGGASIVRASLLSDLVAREAQTPLWVLLTILAAFGLGALHGLEPGHGKALLAFTLVGARATFKQALILAAALTFAHTVAVLILGVILTFATGFATERLFAWITLLSGVAVAFIGARSLAAAVSRAAHEREHARSHAHGLDHDHDRDHGHSHAIPGAAPLRFRSAVVAAMSGGIAPCPAAIVVLLTALHLHRAGYGLLLIVVFSLGLAAVLSGLGLAVVHGAAWLGRHSLFAGVARVAPFVTAAVISVIGATVLAQGLVVQGLRISEPVAMLSAVLAIIVVAVFPALLSTRFAHRTLAIKETT
jgi:ABC-type nickel/cobalt efflux system permease component RcnA